MLVTSLYAYVEPCCFLSICVRKRVRERESSPPPAPPEHFLFHFSSTPMSYSASISALSLTSSGGLIAGGPGRILGKFWRREASGTGSGRLQANVHPRKHTHTHSSSVPRTCSGFLTLLLHFLTDSLVHFVQKNLSFFYHSGSV